VAPYVALAACAGLVGLKNVFGYKNIGHSDLYTLASDGTLQTHVLAGEEVRFTTYRIHPASKITPWGIALAVANNADSGSRNSAKHLRWILKGECAEADYRRFCRAVLHAHIHNVTRNNIDVS
jgi:hypothetical protein